MLGYLLINYLGVNDPSNSCQSCFFTLEKENLAIVVMEKGSSQKTLLFAFTVSLFWKIETYLK